MAAVEVAAELLADSDSDMEEINQDFNEDNSVDENIWKYGIWGWNCGPTVENLWKRVAPKVLISINHCCYLFSFSPSCIID